MEQQQPTVEVTEYERALHQCSSCGWQGRSQLPLGCKEGFSYGGLLSSLVGWLGYGGNLTWSKQRYLLEMLLQVPISQAQRPGIETQFEQVLDNPPAGGWAFDSGQLAARFRRHWSEWFTFLSYPGVKPDNNDAERALRPVVIHRKVSGGARSDWGGQLVAMMFSFLETMRLQGKNALTELFALLTSMSRSPRQTV
jgi:hypothetical protein